MGRPSATRRPPLAKLCRKSWDAHVVKLGACPDAPPRVLKVYRMAALLTPGDDPWVVVVPADATQHGDHGFAQVDHLGARLAVGQPELSGSQVDVLPA